MFNSALAQAVSAEEFEADVWAGALVEPPFDPSVRPHAPRRERLEGRTRWVGG